MRKRLGESMNSYLIDVPVRITIWIRSECQRKQWEVIKKVKPSILFIQSDGGRNDNENQIIQSNRKMIDESIDWRCMVYRFYEECNLGLYAMSKKVIEFIWQKVDRCIFLEDDQIPSTSFFYFCCELLEKYKDDQRIECICGMNHLEKWNCNSDYFFSRQGSIWGNASWKRTYLERKNPGFNYANDNYVMSLLKQRTKHNKKAWLRLNNYAKNEYYEGHVAGGEFWKEFNMYSQNRLQIIPKCNLIKNIGYGNDSTHSSELKYLPKTIRSIYDMKTYEISVPLKHAEYVIPDVEYEKRRNRIMNYNENFFISFLKKIFRNVTFAFTDWNYFKTKSKKKKREK